MEKEVPEFLENFEFLWRLRYDTRRRITRLLNTFKFYLKERMFGAKLTNLHIKYLDK